MYRIKEIFDTVQGEGARSGARSVFVRFAGCNLWDGQPEHRARGKGACSHWCDTDFVGGLPLSARQIVEEVDRLWPQDNTFDRWVVLTGGEPMLQVDSELLEAFQRARVKVAIETNGTIGSELYDQMHHVCVSPKRGSSLAVFRGDELKVIWPGAVTGGWTVTDLAEMQQKTTFRHHFLQPQDPIDATQVDVTFLRRSVEASLLGDQYARNVRECLEVVRILPNWRISLQTHKMMNVR